MALKKNTETNFGFEIQNAYTRVESVQVGKDKMQFQVRSSIDGIKPHFLDVSYECAQRLMAKTRSSRLIHI